MADSIKFDLPKKILRCLPVLAKRYEANGLSDLSQLVSLASCSVEERVDYDNLDGGSYGHALHLTVPAPLFLRLSDSLDGTANRIRTDVAKLARSPGEFVADVFIEVADDETLDEWRNEALERRSHPDGGLSSAQVNRIWKKGQLRIFISHRDSDKQLASQISSRLGQFGLSCFVAHEDIEPTREWIAEIDHALRSMHTLVALLSTDFHASLWTDQEVGFALGRNVPVIPVRLGRDPYGLMGRFQGISAFESKPKDITDSVVAALWKAASIRTLLVESIVGAFESAESFEQANALMSQLEIPDQFTKEQLARVSEVFRSNSQVRDAYNVIARLPTLPSSFGYKKKSK